MSRRFERTVMNWRWWATAPLLLLLLLLLFLPLLLLAAVAWAGKGASNGAAKLAQALIAWRDGK